MSRYETEQFGLQPKEHVTRKTEPTAEQLDLPFEEPAMKAAPFEQPFVDPDFHHSWEAEGLTPEQRHAIRGPVNLVLARTHDGNTDKVTIMSPNHGGNSDELANLLHQGFRPLSDAERDGTQRPSPFGKALVNWRQERRS